MLPLSEYGCLDGGRRRSSAHRMPEPYTNQQWQSRCATGCKALSVCTQATSGNHHGCKSNAGRVLHPPLGKQPYTRNTYLNNNGGPPAYTIDMAADQHVSLLNPLRYGIVDDTIPIWRCGYVMVEDIRDTRKRTF